MVTKTKYKKSYVKRNVTEVAYINYQLAKNGYTQTSVANELGITPMAVWRSINGLSKITRVDEWLRDNLGLEVVNG